MTIRSEQIEIEGDGIVMRAVAAWDVCHETPRPGVLIAPNFLGLKAADEAEARDIAALGYVGLAFDYFGKPAQATGVEEASGWMRELTADRHRVQARMVAALDALRGLDAVDEAHVAAIGFCLGGKCVLDLARTGTAFDGAATFHGVYDAPPFPTAEIIVPKLLMLHGWEDSLCPPDAVTALADELTQAGADWQLHAYGHTKHGFTDPANSGSYSSAAERRAWQAMTYFFEELWGEA